MFGKLIRNGTTERDIRDWLTRNGYYGQSAKFEEVELHAIKRPGWLQVFRFSVTAKSAEEDQWHDLFGVVRDDERYRRFEIEVFHRKHERNKLLTDWSEGMIVRRSRRRPKK